MKNKMMNGLRVDVDGDVLESVDNLDIGVGVRCKFHVCRRRRELKPCPSVSRSNLFVTVRRSSSRCTGPFVFVC